MDERPDRRDPPRPRQRRPPPGRSGRPRLQLGLGPGPRAGRRRRPGLPWIGIFLLVFGGLLLAPAALPRRRARSARCSCSRSASRSSIRWAIARGTGSLYAGAIITALAVPGALTQRRARPRGAGHAVASGIAFLFIALVRLASGGGIGWQAWFGGLLALHRRGEPGPAAGRRPHRAARARRPRRAPVFGGGLRFDRRR